MSVQQRRLDRLSTRGGQRVTERLDVAVTREDFVGVCRPRLGRLDGVQDGVELREHVVTVRRQLRLDDVLLDGGAVGQQPVDDTWRATVPPEGVAERERLGGRRDGVVDELREPVACCCACHDPPLGDRRIWGLCPRATSGPDDRATTPDHHDPNDRTRITSDAVVRFSPLGRCPQVLNDMFRKTR